MTEADLAFAHELADAAGAAILPYFRAPFALEAKADRSPVTAADRASESAMRRLINARFPADGIIGEEYGAERDEAARVWVLDPIDGTRSFVAGRAIFGTLIALVEDGRPVLGLIDQPIQRERWVGAAGRETTFNGAPAAARRCATLAQAHIATSGPGYFQADELAAFHRAAAAARDTLWGGDCYNYGLVASGYLDMVIESGLKLHDFAALVPIVEGAGGAVRDWQGRVLDASSMGQVIAAGDPALIDQAIAALDHR